MFYFFGLKAKGPTIEALHKGPPPKPYHALTHSHSLTDVVHVCTQGSSETSYVYYTAIPRFCAVGTSTGSGAPAVVFPSGGGGGLGSTAAAVWTPGAVVGAPAAAPASEAYSAGDDSARTGGSAIVVAASPNGDASWPTRSVSGGSAVTVCVAESVASGAVVSTTPTESGPADKSSDVRPTTLDSPATGDAGAGDGGAASSSTARTFTCAECRRDFASEKYLNMHMSLHLQPATLAPNVRPCETAAATSSTVEISTAPTPTLLTSQQQQLMMAPPPIRRTKTTTMGAAGTSCTSQWTCQICEKTFAQNSNYKNHIRTHSNERPFVCEICAIGYSDTVFILLALTLREIPFPPFPTPLSSLSLPEA